MIARCLARRIGRVRSIGRGFREKAFVTKTAINFICRYMNKPKALFLGRIEIAPVGEGDLQHRETAVNIRFHEFRGAVD